jgi:hypothetical protein
MFESRETNKLIKLMGEIPYTDDDVEVVFPSPPQKGERKYVGNFLRE